MLKNLFILAFTIVTVAIHGQRIAIETTFEKNVSYDARILNQRLNGSGDSLILVSERTIRQVDIFNEDYMKSIVVNGNTSKIGLGNLPIGEFVVQARIGGSRIVMYVMRSETILENPELLSFSANKATAITSITNNDESLGSATIQFDKTSKKSSSAYWVVHEINTNFGSSKTMSLEDEIETSKMIALNKKELNTEIAKNNKLIVYEVYNTSQFMLKQLRRRKYYESLQSKFFNVIPYYCSDKSEKIVLQNHKNTLKPASIDNIKLNVSLN